MATRILIEKTIPAADLPAHVGWAINGATRRDGILAWGTIEAAELHKLPGSLIPVMRIVHPRAKIVRGEWQSVSESALLSLESLDGPHMVTVSHSHDSVYTCQFCEVPPVPSDNLNPRETSELVSVDGVNVPIVVFPSGKRGVQPPLAGGGYVMEDQWHLVPVMPPVEDVPAAPVGYYAQLDACKAAGRAYADAGIAQGDTTPDDAPFSGEWAGGLTGQDVLDQANIPATFDDLEGFEQTDVLDHWESGYLSAEWPSYATTEGE